MRCSERERERERERAHLSFFLGSLISLHKAFPSKWCWSFDSPFYVRSSSFVVQSYLNQNDQQCRQRFFSCSSGSYFFHSSLESGDYIFLIYASTCISDPEAGGKGGVLESNVMIRSKHSLIHSAFEINFLFAIERYLFPETTSHQKCLTL